MKSHKGLVTSATLLGAALLMAAGCGTARSADAYRNDTSAVLQTRNSAVKSCYDAELERDPTAAGTVVVNFKVQAKTGKIVEPMVDGASTAPASLSQCVVDSLGGLAVKPGDKKTGKATFSWRFSAG